MYGKLFEKLILGSLLSILGFELINPDVSKNLKTSFGSPKEKANGRAMLLCYLSQA
jgi:hypothetical protein